jgi:hypothetical protein
MVAPSYSQPADEPSREPERPATRLQMDGLGRSPGYDRRSLGEETPTQMSSVGQSTGALDD